MTSKGIPGFAIFLTAIGGIVAYSGVRGISVSAAARNLLAGVSPESVPKIASGAVEWNTGVDSAHSSTSGIVATAMRYVGVMYNWAHANPTVGWDCSGFCNWVLGHDLGMTLPGGIKNFNGTWHGPPAAMWYVTTLATSIPRSEIQPGDLCVWPTHMGIAVDSDHMINAYQTGHPTQVTGIDDMAPPGELLRVRRLR